MKNIISNWIMKINNVLYLPFYRWVLPPKTVAPRWCVSTWRYNLMLQNLFLKKKKSLQKKSKFFSLDFFLAIFLFVFLDSSETYADWEFWRYPNKIKFLSKFKTNKKWKIVLAYIFSRPRYWRLSASGGPIKGPQKPRGFNGALNWAPETLQTLQQHGIEGFKGGL